MTPEERADALYRADLIDSSAREGVADAIRQAENEMKERCAKIAEAKAIENYNHAESLISCEEIAKEIREMK